MAGCADPDGPDSPGALFLSAVADEEYEQWYACGPDIDETDAAHEIADGAVPAYTHDMWRTFVDLAAYNETDEHGLMADALTSGDDIGKVAAIALYQIAERLVYALIAEHKSDHDDESEGD
jgi:hypothetical protein